jgi:hypothetical protein
MLLLRLLLLLLELPCLLLLLLLLHRLSWVVKQHTPVLLPWLFEFDVTGPCWPSPLLLLLLAAFVTIRFCCHACVAACFAVSSELLPDVCH